MNKHCLEAGFTRLQKHLAPDGIIRTRPDHLRRAALRQALTIRLTAAVVSGARPRPLHRRAAMFSALLTARRDGAQRGTVTIPTDAGPHYYGIELIGLYAGQEMPVLVRVARTIGGAPQEIEVWQPMAGGHFRPLGMATLLS